ncbi:MAG: ribosome maturation factor RimP [Pseudomonadota bacterium]
MSGNFETLQELIGPIVKGMKFEFVGLEYLPKGQGSLLRIYIDHPDGINVDNCADISRQISAVLDVEDPIQSEYTLEVSSPGVERPLFTKEHYQQFMGKEVKLSLFRPLATSNRKKFKGTIEQVEESESGEALIIIEMDKEQYQLPLSNIKQANIVAKFDFKK